MTAGAIYSEQAYALGKMLDNSSWQQGQKLRDGITPSDFDLVFDNMGAMLFCELSSNCDQWRLLEKGQRWAYQSAIKNNRPHCAVICRHNVKLADLRQIDTRRDIVAFQVMAYDLAAFRISCVIEGNEHWQAFVLAWFQNADGLRGHVIERSTPF